MIVLILKMIFLITLWTLGWKIVTAKDMLLEKVGEWGEQKVEEGSWIFKSLIVCQWCVPNAHGLIFVYPLALLMNILPVDLGWYQYVGLYLFALAGSSFASGMLWDWYLRNNVKKELYENQCAYFDKKDYLLGFIAAKKAAEESDNKKEKRG